MHSHKWTLTKHPCDIKKQNNNIQIKLNPRQIKIKYFSCNANAKTYVIEIMKHLETMEKKK
jgi:hypothetical protein